LDIRFAKTRSITNRIMVLIILFRLGHPYIQPPTELSLLPAGMVDMVILCEYLTRLMDIY